MNVLAQIVRNFDVVAIQEVSSNNIPIIDRLLAVVNRSGAPYQGISSPRVGRTSQKEQYAYIWDSARIVMREQSNYMVNDAADLMHREPFVTSFRVKLPATATAQPFTFTLVNVHTDPDEVAQELNVLDDVFRSIRAYEYPEDDIILLGDLNVNYKQLGELGQIPGIITLMGTSNTNTRGDKQYDHILIDTNLTTEFIRGRSGVYSYEQSLGLSVQQALAISDHRPCWAEFMPVEQPHSPAIANGPSPANRNANSPPQSRL